MSKLRKKLPAHEEKEAIARWESNKPVRLAGFAAAIGLSYDAARKISLEPGFPKVGQWIFREDFEAWRREQVKVAARAAMAQETMTKMPDQALPTKRANRPSSRAGKSGESSSRHDSPSAWPQKAARLLERVG